LNEASRNITPYTALFGQDKYANFADVVGLGVRSDVNILLTFDFARMSCRQPLSEYPISNYWSTMMPQSHYAQWDGRRGMSIQATHEYLSVNKVQLDKANPRIKKWIEMYGDNPTPEQIHLALGAGGDDPQSSGGTTYISLRESIRTNGGIIQPIIVNRTQNGELTVIEGNTRLAIYIDFIDKEAAGNWETIPAIVYDDLDEEAMDAIRLQSHLVGPRAWDPYSKAKYLHFLHSHEHMPFDRLVDYCGGRKSELENYIAAYSDMEKFYRPILDSDSDFDTTRFSGFVELQRPAVKNAILAHGYSYANFAHWIDDRLIDPLNTVRKIPQILSDAAAKQTFLSEGAREALKLLDRAPHTQSLDCASLFELCTATSSKISKVTFIEAERLKNDPDSEITQALLDLSDELSSLIKHIDPKVE